MSDVLAALRLQMEWGADETLGTVTVDRFAPAPMPVAARVAALVPAGPRIAASVATGADTVDALYDEWDGFAAHPLRATATQTVRPAGQHRARVVLIAEAPGSDDDRSGVAFSGKPGELVDRVFRSIGWDRQTMLLLTLVPWRPPGNRKPSEGEIQACLPFVRRLLSIVRPERLILVGSGPARILTGETGSTRRMRGRLWPVQSGDQQPAMQAMVLPALDQWLHNATAKQQMWSDLISLQRTVAAPAN